MSKRTLFIDDSQQRWIAFQQKYSDAIWVDSSWAATREMDHGKFSYIFLDGDLGEHDSGMNVVWDLLDRKLPASETIIIVHSTNAPLGLSMMRELRRAGYFCEYLPFDYNTWIKP